MNEAQTKMAREISEILKDQSLSALERVIKMRAKIQEKNKIPSEDKPQLLETYNNLEIKKAALRNSLLNKKSK